MRKLHKQELLRLKNLLGTRYSQAWYSLRVISEKALMHDLHDYLNENQSLFEESIKDMSDTVKMWDEKFGNVVGAMWLDQFIDTDFDLIKFTSNGEVQRELIELITFNRN